MTHPIRAFFAIELSLKAKQTLTMLVELLQKTQNAHSIRWAKIHNLHITLQFLGQLNPEDIPKMTKNVQKGIKDSPSFDLEIGKLELFPTSHHPRIISMTIEPHTILSELSYRIGQGILSTGYDIERRPFRGHLTLARLNRIDKSYTLPEIDLPALDKIPVNEIVLFKSEPSREGSIYIPLEKYKLGLADNS